MAVNINVPSQVKTYADLAAFPASGALKTIYIAEDTNKTYRWTGSVYVEVSAAGASGITIGTTAITSGTVGRVLFEGTGNVVQESANLFWDNTNGRLGIGTNAPGGKIHVKGSVASEIFKAESTIAALYAQFVSTDGAGEFGIYTDAFYFQPLPSLANGTRFLNGGNAIIMQLAHTGNVLIGTTTDAGYRLDVNGTARVQGVLTAAGNYIQYGTNPNVGIGSTNNGNSFVNNGPALLYASANISATQVYAHNFFTGSFNSTSGVQGLANLAGANFSPTSGTAVFNTINATPTINQTGGANGITRGLYINPTLTAAADFRAIETTAGNVLFGSNFFWDNTNGKLGIGTSTFVGSIKLAVNGIIGGATFSSTHINLTGGTAELRGNSGIGFYGAAGNHIFYGSSTAERMRIIGSTGNVLINTTTDAGYKLDVNGTARVSVASSTLLNQFTVISSLSRLDISPYDSSTYGVILRPSLNNGGAFVPLSLWGSKIQLETSATVHISSNATGGNASAILDVTSTTKGFLPPRMTTTQKNAIASPATGLQVHDTTLNRPCFYDGTTWITL